MNIFIESVSLTLYEHQQETKVTFFSYFLHFLPKIVRSPSKKIIKTSILFIVTCNISTLHTRNNFT